MNIALVNDILGGCLGERKVFWNHLLDAFPGMEGVEWSKVGCASFEEKARRFIDKVFDGQPALVVQNATFLSRVAPDLPTIAFLQDNLRAMGRRDPRQENLLADATLVVANSELTAASYPEFHCRVIPIGVDESLFRPLGDRPVWRARHGIPLGVPVGIFVGAFNDVKGWPQIQSVIQDHPGIYFILVTKHEENFSSPNARTFQKVDQQTLVELHACADFFILGSPVETQCLAALEASFCGLPVVMNNTGIYMDFPDREALGFFGLPFQEAIPKVLAATWNTRSVILQKGLSVADMVAKWRVLFQEVEASNPILQPCPMISTYATPQGGRDGVALSVLVCTLPNRVVGCLPRLLAEIHRQTADRKDVEVLVLYDNWKRTVGRKRDDLIQMATGRFLTFIDDDDTIAPDYFEEILGAIDTYETSNEPLDCIVFDTHFRKLDHGAVVDEYNCQYGIELDYVKDERGWFGKPAHTMVWRSAIAKRHRFSDLPWGEDVDWVKRACLDIRDQHRIPKALYHYDWNLQGTESSLHNWNRLNTKPPVQYKASAPIHPPGSTHRTPEGPGRREALLVSIQTWGKRTRELLQAYLSTFAASESVSLLLLAGSSQEAEAARALCRELLAGSKAPNPDLRVLQGTSGLLQETKSFSRLHVLHPSGLDPSRGSHVQRLCTALLNQ